MNNITSIPLEKITSRYSHFKIIYGMGCYNGYCIINNVVYKFDTFSLLIKSFSKPWAKLTKLNFYERMYFKIYSLFKPKLINIPISREYLMFGISPKGLFILYFENNEYIIITDQPVSLYLKNVFYNVHFITEILNNTKVMSEARITVSDLNEFIQIVNEKYIPIKTRNDNLEFILNENI